MEANLDKIVHLRIARTIEALKKNNMEAVFVPTRTEALAFLKTMLKEGQTIGSGGSVTLSQIGANDLILSSAYHYVDRKEKGAKEVDTFLCSSNAITEDGYLYNVDGSGNRVSSIISGPKQVIIFAGYNKIVENLSDAVQRVKCVACPANCIRLDKDTYCAKNGKCFQPVCDSKKLMGLEAGACPETICSHMVITGTQCIKNRITVVIIGEELGY